jgi:ribosome-binding factor A
MRNSLNGDAERVWQQQVVIQRDSRTMPREFPRTRRVSEQIQRELAELIRGEIKDPRLGMVSVTGAEVSRDLAYAKVYVTILADDSRVEESLRVLNRASGFLRQRLGQRMIIRVVPQLRFILDRSLERGARMSSLIDEAVKSDSDDKGEES